jgi:hypothetical protein
LRRRFIGTRLWHYRRKSVNLDNLDFDLSGFLRHGENSRQSRREAPRSKRNPSRPI